jgi:hypothetical protein
MQSTTERGRLLAVATRLYLEKQGFTVYFWQEWALQEGLSLQDTGKKQRKGLISWRRKMGHGI